MADLAFGEAASLRPRIDTDLTTPILQGFKLAGAQEQRRAMAEQKRQEQEQKILDDMISVTGKGHAWVQPEIAALAQEPFKAYASGADRFTYAVIKNKSQQGINDLEAMSKRFDAYDTNTSFVKDPILSQSFSFGDRDSYAKRKQQLIETGEYTPYIDPLSGAYIPRIDVKDEINKNLAFNNNPSLYSEERRESLGNGGEMIYYGITDPVKRDLAIKEVLADRDAVLAQLLNNPLYREERKALDSVAGLTPEERTDRALYRTIDKMLPSHVERVAPGTRVNVNVSTGQTPVNNRSLFTDIAQGASSVNKLIGGTPPATYDEYIGKLNNVIGGKIKPKDKDDNQDPVILLNLPAQELGKSTILTANDQNLYRGQSGDKQVVLDKNVAVRATRMAVGTVYRDANGKDIIINSSNYDKYKGELTKDNVYTAFIIEYEAAPGSEDSPIKDLDKDKYKEYTENAKSELTYPSSGGRRPIYQIVAGDEIGNTVLTERYPTLASAYNKVIQASLTKQGQRPSGVELNTNPQGVKKVSSGQTATNNVKAPVPTFTDWQKKNPGKTIADYRKVYPKQQ